MSDQTKKVEPKVVEDKKPTAQEFAERYQKLCEELGYRIVVTPVWVARDDGTWSTQLQMSVGALPKEEK